MPYCSKCGNTASEGDEFCKSCGAAVGTAHVNDKAIVGQTIADQQFFTNPPITEPNFPPPPIANTPRITTWGQAPIQKKSHTAIVILSILLGLAIIGAGVFGFLYVDTNSTISIRDQTITSLNADKVDLQTQLSDSKSQLTTAQNNILSLNGQLSLKQSQLTSTQDQLATIQAKYPLKNFSSLFQLQNWASAHIQPYSAYADGWYAGALRVQEAAMKDGYYVSACMEGSSGVYLVSMQAMVGTTLYVWNPEVGTVYLYLSGIG